MGHSRYDMNPASQRSECVQRREKLFHQIFGPNKAAEYPISKPNVLTVPSHSNNRKPGQSSLFPLSTNVHSPRGQMWWKHTHWRAWNRKQGMPDATASMSMFLRVYSTLNPKPFWWWCSVQTKAWLLLSEKQTPRFGFKCKVLVHKSSQETPPGTKQCDSEVEGSQYQWYHQACYHGGHILLESSGCQCSTHTWQVLSRQWLRDAIGGHLK